MKLYIGYLNNNVYIGSKSFKKIFDFMFKYHRKEKWEIKEVYLNG